MDVETAISALRERHGLDHRRVRGLAEVEGCFSSASEGVIFSDDVVKVTSRGKPTDRVLVLTGSALYNFLPSRSKMRRRIPLASISRIIISNDSTDFLVDVGDRYYWFKSVRRREIVATISEAGYSHIPAELVGSGEFEFILQRLHRGDKDKDPSSTRELQTKAQEWTIAQGFEYMDFAYIANNVLAMAFPGGDRPGDGTTYSGAFGMLEHFHPDAYMVVNLAAERRYDPSNFAGRSAYFPVPDHAVPSLQMVFDCCYSMSKFIEGDPNNHVVVVHCSTGRGRTGVMIACFLLYTGVVDTPEEAVSMFDSRRSKNRLGITNPSQRRYVTYFHTILTKNRYQILRNPRFLFEEEVPVILANLQIVTIPRFGVAGGCHPYIRIIRLDQEHVYDSRTEIDPQSLLPDEDVLEIPMGVEISGNVRIEVYHQERDGVDTKICGFWVATAALDPSNPVCLVKQEIDKAYKDWHCEHFEVGFGVVLELEQAAPASTRHSSIGMYSFAKDQVTFEAPPRQRHLLGHVTVTDSSLRLQYEDLMSVVDHGRKRINELIDRRKELIRENRAYNRKLRNVD